MQQRSSVLSLLVAAVFTTSSLFPAWAFQSSTCLKKQVPIAPRWGSTFRRGADTRTTAEPNHRGSISLPGGTLEGFFVVKNYTYDPSKYDLEDILNNEKRLKLSSENITVPVALMLWDPEAYPSLSRARKACRKRSIVIYKNNSLVLARVGDRVCTGDVLGVQERHSHGAYSQVVSILAKPTFELPVIYEDEHMAIVNKPAGISVYEEGGKGRRNVRFALPYVLQAPPSSIEQALARPETIHRLDKPTSGLLVVGKTKPATVHLSQQFEHRRVQKTYTAIVHGIPKEANILTSREAFQMGFDVDKVDANTIWHLAEILLDSKTAVTLWRIVETYPTTVGHLSLIELKPKTGRYHQLRRQMAWMYKCPIVGDTTYGDKTNNNKRWKRGLMLCANRIVLRHPYLRESTTGEEVLVTASIDLPNKFHKYLQAEQNRAKYATE